MGKVLAKAMTRIAEFIDPDKQESPRISVKEPDQFDGSDQRKLRGFLLQLKLNFRAKKRSFQSDSDKVTYALSFLKGTALDYFEPYLTDNPDQEPAWLNNYDEFVEELMINFCPYNQVADAEVELEQLVMKDNHKATKFFVDFYRISALLNYNKQALHRKAYLALPKRIKDELIHFDKPQNLDDLQDLVQKIDQCYWERRSEVSREMLMTLRPDQKSDKTSKLNPNSDRKANPTPSTSGSGSKDKDKDKSKSGTQNQKKPDLMDKLGKDGKLTTQEHQRRLDNELCLLCGKSGHMVCNCPKSTKARAAASDPKTSENKAKSSAKATEAKK